MIDEGTGHKPEKVGIVGIDLGTTNTVVSYIDDDGEIKHVRVAGSTAIPSVMFFQDKANIYYGLAALRRAQRNSRSTAKLFKRKIGTNEKIEIVFDAKEGASETNPQIFIIDTNCLVDKPDLLDSISKDETVILPITVAEELRYRSNEPATKYSAQKALSNIENREKYPCKIVLEQSDLSLLPEDFFKPTSQNDKNDDKVLSIAIKHKDDGAVLITSDKRLGRIKASACDVQSVILNDFILDRLTQNKDENDASFSLSGEEATAYFLRFINSEICKALDCDSIEAVITVPVNFNNIQVEATKRAAIKAGINKVHIEKEPFAASIAYSASSLESKKILVYDFGGGTFDVAIVKYDKDKNEFDVLSTDGDPKLGGQDITDEFVSYIYETLEDEDDLHLFEQGESALPPEQYWANVQIIEAEAERVKRSLSSVDEEVISLANLYTPAGTPLNKRIPITKSEFEEIISDIVRKPTACVERALKDAGVNAEDIDVVILSGGTSLMPIVREKVQNFFGKIPASNKDPATLIADGASILARNIYTHNTREESSSDTRDSKVEPEDNSSKPGTESSEKDNGQATLSDTAEIIIRTKVIADIGIAADDYDFDCIIPRGTVLPSKGVKTYYLMEDNQDTIEVKVYSRKKNNPTTKATHCDFIDKITISGIPSYKKDQVRVDVSFILTQEYELNVSAEIKSMKTGDVLIQSDELSVNKDSLR